VLKLYSLTRCIVWYLGALVSMYWLTLYSLLLSVRLISWLLDPIPDISARQILHLIFFFLILVRPTGFMQPTKLASLLAYVICAFLVLNFWLILLKCGQTRQSAACVRMNGFFSQIDYDKKPREVVRDAWRLAPGSVRSSAHCLRFLSVHILLLSRWVRNSNRIRSFSDAWFNILIHLLLNFNFLLSCYNTPGTLWLLCCVSFYHFV